MITVNRIANVFLAVIFVLIVIFLMRGGHDLVETRAAARSHETARQKGDDGLSAIVPQLPVADSVRVGWALLSVVGTMRSGSHTHDLRITYFTSMPACEAARSSSSACLPIALPPS